MAKRFDMLAILAALGCAPGAIQPRWSDAGPMLDSGVVDASVVAIDATPAIDASAPIGLAPPGTVLDAVPAMDGAQTIAIAPDAPAILELVAQPDEHVGIFLRFEPGDAAVVMRVDRWDGSQARELGMTDAGGGIRTLAIFEPLGPRTHWVRLESEAPLSATLEIVRTPFHDGAVCDEGDCALLLQLPLPIDFATDGYSWNSGTIMRYWFGRRDLVMLVRYASRAMADRGNAPCLVGDLSQWDALTPGTDVGAPRHGSHQRGKDVDLSLYGTDGLAPWRSFCTTQSDGAGGRECVPGTIHDYDGLVNAIRYAGFLQSGRVTMSFLDRELIGPTIDGAQMAASTLEIDPTLVPLYSDGHHLEHWPNHNNHIHVRVSEAPYGAGGDLPPEPFEPP